MLTPEMRADAAPQAPKAVTPHDVWQQISDARVKAFALWHAPQLDAAFDALLAALDKAREMAADLEGAPPTTPRAAEPPRTAGRAVAGGEEVAQIVLDVLPKWPATESGWNMAAQEIATRLAARGPARPAPAPDDAAALTRVARALEWLDGWVVARTHAYLGNDLATVTRPEAEDAVRVSRTRVMDEVRAALAAARAREGDQPAGLDGVALLRASLAHAENAAAVFTAPEIRLPVRNAADALDVALARALAALRPARDGEGRGEG